MPKLSGSIPVERLLSKQIGMWEVRKKLSKAELEKEIREEPWQQGYITISRLTGSLGGEIAHRVADLLGWQVFDKELVHEIAKSSKMRKQVIESLDERSQDEMQRWVQGIIDSDTISSDRYLHHLMRVLYTIASHGKAVIIGRGANFLLESHKGVRVYIYAPLQLRVRRLCEREKLSEKEARAVIREADNRRLAFIRQYFHRDANDPAGYDLIINTGELCPELAAQIIYDTLVSKYKTFIGLMERA